MLFKKMASVTVRMSLSWPSCLNRKATTYGDHVPPTKTHLDNAFFIPIIVLPQGTIVSQKGDSSISLEKGTCKKCTRIFTSSFVVRKPILLSPKIE